MRRRFKCDPKWITVRHPARCAESIVQAKSTPANVASTTAAISLCTARAAGMARRPSGISALTGSTKTVIKRKHERDGGFYHVCQQGNRSRQSGPRS